MGILLCRRTGVYYHVLKYRRLVSFGGVVIERSLKDWSKHGYGTTAEKFANGKIAVTEMFKLMSTYFVKTSCMCGVDRFVVVGASSPRVP